MSAPDPSRGGPARVSGVAVLDDFNQVYERTEGVRRLREAGLPVTIFTQPFGDPAALRGFDVLVGNRERTRFTDALFAALPDLRLLVQTGAHAYHIDFDAARARGIEVARATGGSAGAAELTFGLMLELTRHIGALDAQVRQGRWPTSIGQMLEGKVLGLIGLGRLGQRVAAIAGALRMQVLAWSPSLTDERARAAGAQRRELDDLLAASDFVSVHAALSPSSRGLLDARRLALMKPTAFLVNTARGPIVGETALVAALERRAIAGAGLDVFDVEPLPPDHPFLRLPNVVLTPHIGWTTDRAFERFAEDFANVILAYTRGEELPRFAGH